MIATSTFFDVTTTGCTGNCTCCTVPCTVVIIYIGGATITTGTTEQQRKRDPWPDSYVTRMPDPVDDYFYPEPVDIETIQLWRRESRKKSRYSNILEHRPLIKRRTLNSKSGWLTRKSRLRKKGKK